MKSIPKILVVDDDPVNCDVVCKHLRQDYESQSALSGEALFEKLKTFTPDLILLDVMMPGIDGYEACRRLKENPKTASIPVIFLTAATGETVKGLSVGAVDFIAKPMRASELRARIKLHLKLRQTLSQLERANNELQRAHDALERRVQERTEQLQKLNDALRSEVYEKNLVEERLRFLATHDRITRLASYENFHHSLEGHILRAQRDNTPHVFMRVDIVNLDAINEALGLEAGSDLLMSVADLLRHRVPPRFHIGRIGGAKFGLSAPATGIDEANRVARLLLDDTQAPQFFVRDGKPQHIEVTVALVDTHDNVRSSDQAIAWADRAARNAINEPTRISRFREGSERSIEVQRLAAWAERLKNTIDDKLFTLFYQRIEPLQTDPGRVHIEVLIRMREKGGYVAPAAFLPYIERLNLAPKLDLWVLKRVLKWLKSPIAEEWGIEKVAINLSGQSLNTASFVSALLKEVAAAGDYAKQICFELTEQIAIVNLEKVSKIVSQLRSLGAHVALDDFGAGFSSYGYLKSLPADYLKIDGQFVRDLINDPVSLALVKSMNDVGHATGKLTIAEYVENDEIRDMLKTIGIDFAQGYGIHRPELLPLFE